MIAMFFSQLLYWPTCCAAWICPIAMRNCGCYQHPHERCERCIASGNTQDQGRAENDFGDACQPKPKAPAETFPDW